MEASWKDDTWGAWFLGTVTVPRASHVHPSAVPTYASATSLLGSIAFFPEIIIYRSSIFGQETCQEVEKRRQRSGLNLQ
jgi:hypothetical protein